MLHIFIGKDQSAFIPAYYTLACRAVITREAKQRHEFLSTHMKAPPALNIKSLIDISALPRQKFSRLQDCFACMKVVATLESVL
jgi:hypothetical protein